MARFIIEVSDGYIHERADISNYLLSDKGSFVKKVMELTAFSKIEHDIQNGISEFLVASADLNDEDIRELFNDVVTQAAALSIVAESRKEPA